jgi:decaprenyl-phosphate phosphoribosyltransferase
MPRVQGGDDGCRGERTLGQPGGRVVVAAQADAIVGSVPAAHDPVFADRVAVAARARRGRGAVRLRRMRAFVVLARPRQWVKNLLVVAAPAAAGVIVDGDVPRNVALTFVAFCLLSGGTYAVNDVRDVLEDREHPRKRSRPVAAGDLASGEALSAAAVLMLAGLLLCLAVRPWLLVVGAGYLAVTFTYSLFWRRIAFVDVAAIAAGFVLRAVAGGIGAPVPLSKSFLLVVTFGAVFVAAGKRHAELVRPRIAGDAGTAPRRVLAIYTAQRLRLVLVGSSALAFVAYCVWALHDPAHLSVWRALTLVPFAAGLSRYAVLLGRGAGEAPEQLLIEDSALRLLALTWAIIFAMSVHATG